MVNLPIQIANVPEYVGFKDKTFFFFCTVINVITLVKQYFFVSGVFDPHEPRDYM